MLIEHYARLLDFPCEEDRYESIVHEARAKLSGTHLFINGSLCYVNDLNIECLNIHKFGQDEPSTIYDNGVKDVEVFLPATGVYSFKGTYFFLYKRTKKQWKKSFNWNYYAANLPLPSHAVYSLVNQTPVYMYTEKDGCIYYIDHRVGFVKNGVYKCTDLNFSFEFDSYVKGLKNGN